MGESFRMRRNRKQSLKKVVCGCAGALLAISVCMGTAEPMACKAEGNIGAKSTESVGIKAQNPQDQVASGRYLNIGSVSKMYTVAAVMQLVDQGKVDLDAPVVDYISDFKLADERYQKITVRMLMNHTSGLMGSVYGEIFLLGDASSDYHDSFLSILQKEGLKYGPGKCNCYCNDGFTLLEILVERVSGMAFTDYLEENICKPLSLEKTGTPWNMDAEDHVSIYVNGDVEMAPERGSAIGAGGIISTANDVSSFGAAFFRGNQALLSEKAKKEMAKNYQVGCLESFGLGWDEVTKKDYEKAGVTVLSKGGDTFFQHASLVVAPEEKISVSVLSSGGDSSLNEEMALELLDIALLEQGVSVEHPAKEQPELSEAVPEKYLSYEGVYANAYGTVSITFPNQQYMQIVSLTYDTVFEQQYMYSKDGNFVEMSGDVASGKAIPVRPVNMVAIEEKNGQVYLMDQLGGYSLYKASENKVSDQVQKAWEQRDGISYYYVSGSASDETYAIENHCATLHTSEAARGYVNGRVMLDENQAGYQRIMPGTASRDLSNVRMEKVNGKEYLCMDEYNYRYISEECIPVLTEDITEVELKTKEASWYKLGGAKNMTLRLELPEKAAVYVYDQYGNIRYSSHMIQYGNEVPLPENGSIVFIGETGGQVNVRIIK
ncbi:MAG: beta-lactamase family protein [Lachnospiraceae bacterium]|nr:beta-lactamase family protein [Lachnospiraceae bacterium]